MKEIPQFLIAAPSSSSGKTTVSRAIMAALTRRGMRVQPFKCGPDYIDTKFHEAVCGRPSVNLDTYMSSAAHLKALYAAYLSGADVSIAEGMMGMYDGYDRDRGSSAEIAALLSLPVVMVVNASSAAYSTAALLKGFVSFRDNVRIVGVIFTKVGSPRHYAMLAQACDDLQLPCLGYLPKDPSLEQKTRYLGLDFGDTRHVDNLSRLVALTEEHIDLSTLLTLTRRPLPAAPSAIAEPRGNINITVARDEESFSFLYTEHLDILRSLGKVTYYSPLDDKPLPTPTDFLYLPGGYPERHAAQLSAAKVSLRSVRDYVENGGRTLAECGGMIYLSGGVHFDDNPTFVPLVGVLPFTITCRKEHRKLSLGYRSISLDGRELRGHEFHYTQIHPSDTHLMQTAAAVVNAKGAPTASPVFRHKRLLASYVHLYWGETDIISLL